MFSKLFSKKKISDIRFNPSREEIIKRGRILKIDDERPDLTDDLEKARFSVNYVPDIKKTNLDLTDNSVLDLIILDFGNIGKEFGIDKGLSLLRHIKRINFSCSLRLHIKSLKK